MKKEDSIHEKLETIKEELRADLLWRKTKISLAYKFEMLYVMKKLWKKDS